jgi:hypothetical protein
MTYDKEVFEYIYHTDNQEENRILTELLDERMETVDCYFNLLETSNEMEVFFRIFVKDYHRKLIPLVYFNRSLAHYEAKRNLHLFNPTNNPGLAPHYSASTKIASHNKKLK